LAGEGCRVHLVDIVPEHVQAAAKDGLLTAEVGDARRLTQADASVDAVLLLGPLYHLVDRAERTAALVEARRVLRPGGVLLSRGHRTVHGGPRLGAERRPFQHSQSYHRHSLPWNIVSAPESVEATVRNLPTLPGLKKASLNPRVGSCTPMDSTGTNLAATSTVKRLQSH
jgi:SAM-dependent methyltransferase